MFYINYTSKNYIIDYIVMQKNDKNASILIWAIFLSIIISLWFISISTQINKTLRNNQDIQNQILNTNELKNILQSDNPSSQELSDSSYLNIRNSNSYIWSLEENETKIFSFSWTSSENISINLENFGKIKYKYDIWTTNQEYNTLSWWTVTFSSNLTQTDNNSLLTIENLWWFAKFRLESNWNFISPEQYYEVWKTIWNKNVLIHSAEIK